MPFREPPPQRFENIANFRDLGGHRAHDGRQLRRGVLFRSGHLCRASEDDVAELARLGLKRVFDFRTLTDISADGHDRLPDGTEHVRLPMPDPAKTEDIRTLITRAGPDGLEPIFGDGKAEAMMRHGAERLVTHRLEAYSAFLAQLCDDAPFPALFHCSAGKDRAGWAASVVLLAIDVPREEVVEQYLLSNREADRLRENFRDPRGPDWHGVLRPLLEVRREYIEASFEAVHERWGGFDAYLRDGLGITEAQLERLRERLLE